MKKYIRYFLAFASIILLSGCGDDSSSEEAFHQTLAAMEEAIENKDISDFMSYVDESYSDNQSRVWHDIRRIAQLYVLRNKNLHLFRHVTQMDIVEDESANVVILVALAGQPIDSVAALSSIRAELMQFNVYFEYDPDRDETWKAVSAEWKRAGLDDFL